METKRMLKRDSYVQPKALQKSMEGSLDQMMGHCLSELMNVRTSIHQLHLTITGPGSYAAHKALNKFYDAIPDLVDTLVEGYQGATEKILKFEEMVPRQLKTVEDALDYMREMYDRITKLQAKVPYSEIVNNMDLVKDAINSAKYKLLFLK
jgi:DNA-binding ferritin-like protein